MCALFCSARSPEGADIDFNRDILPILFEHCFACHGPDAQKREADLRLDEAGGGIHGATDEFGFKAVENPVSVHDLHATLLHLLGIDHKRLTYRYAGRDFRLTDVHGKVVRDVVA